MTDTQFKSQKATTDCAQAFLVFMSLVGDVNKTAHALNRDPEFIQRLADSEGWSQKIQHVSLMSRGQRPGDWERAVNRALIFVQSHQMRGIVDSVLSKLRDMDADELMEFCSVTDKNGVAHFSAKPLTDLTTAIEACSRISLVALGDTVTERVERDEAAEGGGMKVSDLHAAIVAGLANLGNGTAEAIVLEQAKKVSVLAETAGPSQPAAAGQELPTSSSEMPEPVPAPEVRRDA